nr:zinc finger BED domain-containing protein RICESLEEPER 2-like [Spinacia oleracea]
METMPEVINELETPMVPQTQANAQGLLVDNILILPETQDFTGKRIKDGLKVIEHAVVKVRDCVKYIKWSETRKNNFRDCVRLAKIGETKSLWLDVSTRWNSTYMMLKRASLYREAFMEMVIKDSSFKRCPDFEEWENLQKIQDVMEPFSDITKLFS